MRSTSLVLSAMLFATAGCSSIFDALIPRHEYSGKADEVDLVCLRPVVKPGAEVAPLILLAPIITAAAGFVIDQGVKAVEKEGKQYTAQYSGRMSELLFTTGGQADESKPIEAKARFSGFRLQRFAGEEVNKRKGVSCDALSVPAFEFEADLDVSADPPRLRVTPTKASLRHSKAKVSSWSPKLRLNIDVAISAVADGKDGPTAMALGSHPILLPSIDLDKIEKSTEDGKEIVEPWERGKDELSYLATPWYPLPNFVAKKQKPGDFGPITITVTVTESNALGDTIGDAAKAAGGVKEKLAEAIGKMLSGDQQQSKSTAGVGAKK